MTNYITSAVKSILPSASSTRSDPQSPQTNSIPLDRISETSQDIVDEPRTPRDSGVWGLDSSRGTSPSSLRHSSISSSNGSPERTRFRALSESSSAYEHLHQSNLSRNSSSASRPGDATLPPVKTALAREFALPLLSRNSAPSTDSAEPTKRPGSFVLRHDRDRTDTALERLVAKSPTELLNNRLNLSPKRPKKPEFLRGPATALPQGCILPSVQQARPLNLTSVRATTVTGAPSWWCRSDKQVVYEGKITKEDGSIGWATLTSKGLAISRKNGSFVMIRVPLDCEHCRGVLGRTEWIYNVKVCPRSVCRECKARCELEENGQTTEKAGADTNDEQHSSPLEPVKAREESEEFPLNGAPTRDQETNMSRECGAEGSEDIARTSGGLSSDAEEKSGSNHPPG